MTWQVFPRSGATRARLNGLAQKADWPGGGEIGLFNERRGIPGRPWVVRHRPFGANVWGTILAAEKTKKAAIAEAERLASIQPTP